MRLIFIGGVLFFIDLFKNWLIKFKEKLAPQLLQKVFFQHYFVDILDYIHEKIKIMRVYESELGKHPLPRSVKSIKPLSLHRRSIVVVKYAEEFLAVKTID